MNKSIVYNTEDISALIENVPDNLKGPVTKLSMDIMTHDAYNNAK